MPGRNNTLSRWRAQHLRVLSITTSETGMNYSRNAVRRFKEDAFIQKESGILCLKKIKNLELFGVRRKTYNSRHWKATNFWIKAVWPRLKPCNDCISYFVNIRHQEGNICAIQTAKKSMLFKLSFKLLTNDSSLEKMDLNKTTVLTKYRENNKTFNE